MESQWKRFWDTGVFPFLEFMLSLSLGYCLSLFFYVGQSELSLIDTNDAAYPFLQGAAILAFSLGFLVRKLIVHLPKSISVGLCFIFSIQLSWLGLSDSQDFLIDYIFNFEIIFLLTLITFLSLGLYCGSIRDFRFMSFALGIVVFTFYSLFDPNQKAPFKTIQIVLLSLLFVYFGSNLFTKSAFSIRYYKIRSKIGNHPLFAPFYSVSLSLLLAYVGLHLYFQPGAKIPLVLAISFAILFARLASLYNPLKRETKNLYFLGRGLILLSIFFFFSQSYWNHYHIILCVLLGGMIGFFKPNQNSSKEYAIIVAKTILLFFGSIGLYHWNTSLFTKSLVSIAFVPILLSSFLLQTHIILIPRLLMLGIALVISFVFYSPPSIRVTSPFAKQESYDPIPYKILDLAFNSKDFVYFGPLLPFNTESFLPKRSDIKGKIVVIGLSNNNSLTISYIEQLRKEEHPFLVFVSREKEGTSVSTSALSLLNRKTFWGFDVYFPSYYKNPLLFSNELSKDWKFKHFDEKLDKIKVGEVNPILDNTIRYSTTDLKKEAFTIKQLYYESYLSYAEYYFGLKQYRLALQSIAMARVFQSPEPKLLRIAFESLKLTTPEAEMIPILQDLSQDGKYQEFAWNTLIPMYESLGDYENSLQTMLILEKYYRIQGKTALASELELARVRIFLNQENWKDSETLIVLRSKENPNSVIWERLRRELTEKKESAKRPYQKIEMREARIQ